MNIAYFRTSKFDREETLSRLKQAAEEGGFTISGGTDLPNTNSSVLNVCRPEWAEAIINTDHKLLGLLPCTVSVIGRGEDTIVSTATPALLGQVAPTEEILTLAQQAEAALRTLVESAAGAEPRKAQALKLYSTHACPYCKMEKAWLDDAGTPHDVIYVDDDQKAAEDLVQRTGQMGVPVTEVIYDSGESEFIVGFDKQKLAGVVSTIPK